MREILSIAFLIAGLINGLEEKYEKALLCITICVLLGG